MGKREIQHVNLVGGATIVGTKPKKRKHVAKAKSRKTSITQTKARETSRSTR